MALRNGETDTPTTIRLVHRPEGEARVEVIPQGRMEDDAEEGQGRCATLWSHRGSRGACSRACQAAVSLPD